MRLSALLITLVFACGLTFGQAPADAKPSVAAGAVTNQEPLQAEIIHVKTLTGESFNRLANMLSVFNVQTRADANLRSIIVYAPKDVVAQMRRIVAELDSPGSEAAIGRNIEMTLTLLRCSTKAPAVPTTLGAFESVAKQLRASTQYKDVQLWDVVPLRLQEGKDTTESMVLPPGEPSSVAATAGKASELNIRITPEAATRKGQNWSVRFSRMELGFRVPVFAGNVKGSDGAVQATYSYQQISLNTAGDFLEGQSTVLGKVSGTADDTAIFVVVSLKVLE